MDFPISEYQPEKKVDHENPRIEVRRFHWSYLDDILCFTRQNKIVGQHRRYFEVWNVEDVLKNKSNWGNRCVRSHKILKNCQPYDSIIAWNDSIFLSCGGGNAISAFSIEKYSKVRRVVYRKKSSFFYLLKLTEKEFLCADSNYHDLLIIEYVNDVVKVKKKVSIEGLRFAHPSCDLDVTIFCPSRKFDSSLYCASISDDFFGSTVKLVDYGSEKVLKEFKLEKKNIESISNYTNPSNEEIVVCSCDDGYLYLLNSSDKGENNKKKNMTNRIHCRKISNNGWSKVSFLHNFSNRFLFLGSDDGQLRIINISNQPHESSPESSSPNNNKLKYKINHGLVVEGNEAAEWRVFKPYSFYVGGMRRMNYFRQQMHEKHTMKKVNDPIKRLSLMKMNAEEGSLDFLCLSNAGRLKVLEIKNLYSFLGYSVNSSPEIKKKMLRNDVRLRSRFLNESVSVSLNSTTEEGGGSTGVYDDNSHPRGVFQIKVFRNGGNGEKKKLSTYKVLIGLD